MKRRSAQLTKGDVQGYLALFPELVLEILENPKLKDLEETRQRISKILFKTVPNEEVLHGLATTLAFKHLVLNPTSAEMKDCFVLGWCLQMYATCYFIIDDLLDKSQTRHYKPCWYLVENNGFNALNDVGILESCVYHLLEKHFGKREFYPRFLEMFHDISFKMAISQTLEAQLSRNNIKDNLNGFNMEAYNQMVKYKMCFYPTYIHVAVAMNLAGIKDETQYIKAKVILSKIDFHFQPRDDFLDCFGDNSSHESETGNDIEEARCSWNICTAFELANQEQKEILRGNYGKSKDYPQCTLKVKQIYEDLDLPKVFQMYEDDKFQEILNLIESSKEEENKLPNQLFMDMMWASFPNKKILQGEKRNEGLTGKQLKLMTKDIPDFLSVFPDIVETLMFDGKRQDLDNISGWISRIMHYNVPMGKKTRGLTTSIAYQSICGDKVNEENRMKSYILGWCVELLQAAALVADDIMDSSITRRGLPCWYKVENLGYNAYHDATILESAVYEILKHYFGNESYYAELLDLFQDVTFKTACGQELDILTGKTTNLNDFTMKLYFSIVKYKTSYYTFYLPLSLAMAMGGTKSKEILETSKAILLDIGHFFQVQDDYLDCFGDLETIGKVGTDISDGKCSWLIVTALELSDSQQLEIIKENYGKGLDFPEKIEKVKLLYKDLGIPELYQKVENDTHAFLSSQIKEMTNFCEEHKELLLQILETTYKRKA